MPRRDPLGDDPLDAAPILLRLTRRDLRRVVAAGKRHPFHEAPFCGEKAVIVRVAMRLGLDQLERAPKEAAIQASDKKGS